MKQVKKGIPQNTQKGIPLKVRAGPTVHLEVTDESLAVHSGLSLFYAMAEALEIPRILDENVRVKERESGYPESEHILVLAAKGDKQWASDPAEALGFASLVEGLWVCLEEDSRFGMGSQGWLKGDPKDVLSAPRGEKSLGWE